MAPQHVHDNVDLGPDPHSATNNELFQTMRNLKYQHMERERLLWEERVSVRESIARQQKVAESHQHVTQAGEQYEKNINYVAINSGKNPSIRVSKFIHPLSPEECDIYRNLVKDMHDSNVIVLANHNVDGITNGFRFTCKGDALLGKMPLCRKMFFRWEQMCTVVSERYWAYIGLVCNTILV